MAIKKPRKDNKIVPIEKKGKEIEDFIGKADKTESDILEEKKLLEVHQKLDELEKLNSPSAKRNKLNMTIRFNNHEKEQLNRLKDKKGLTRIGVIRLAISDLIEKELG